jgi:hypothetical protein
MERSPESPRRMARHRSALMSTLTLERSNRQRTLPSAPRQAPDRQAEPPCAGGSSVKEATTNTTPRAPETATGAPNTAHAGRNTEHDLSAKTMLEAPAAHVAAPGAGRARGGPGGAAAGATRPGTAVIWRDGRATDHRRAAHVLLPHSEHRPQTADAAGCWQKRATLRLRSNGQRRERERDSLRPRFDLLAPPPQTGPPAMLEERKRQREAVHRLYIYTHTHMCNTYTHTHTHTHIHTHMDIY